MIYENVCGQWKIHVSDPHPAWVTLEFGGIALPHIKVEDLRDLRHLIDRAEAAIIARGAE